MEPKTIDLRGLRCPEPQKLTEQELSAIKEGVLIVLLDSPSNYNVERLAKKSGLKVESSKKDNYWELKITKTPYSKPEAGAFKRLMRALKRQKTEEKDILLIVASDTMGKEEDIGRVLMKGFFETMKVTREIPHTIFFLNAGVKLTTGENELIGILKDIEAMGVEVYSCGTCLKHYGLEAALKVGFRGTTNHIVEGMKDFKKVVWVG